MLNIQVDGIEYRFFDHLYAVSRCGKVLRNHSVVTPIVRRDGYLTLGRRGLMHRVVAYCWIPNPTNAKYVHHKNENKADNRADNLEWMAPTEHCNLHEFGKKQPYVRTKESIAKYIATRTGMKHTPENAAIKRELLDKVRPSTVCKFQGVTYPSVSAAARFVGIPSPTFRVRALSKNFPEYEIVSLYYGKPES